MSKIIIASGPVIVENNKVLLNQHGEDNFWKFCGGRVDDFGREGLLEAAKRETLEEIGVKIDIINPQPFIMYVTKIKDGQMIDVILVHYLARVVEGEKIVLGEDIRDSKWIDINDLEKNDLAPNILPVLKHFGFIS